MKIAISLPDEVCVRTSQRAEELGLSRSDLFARDAQHYLDHLDAQPLDAQPLTDRALTGQINDALDCIGVPDEAATYAAVAGRRLLAATDDEW